MTAGAAGDADRGVRGTDAGLRRKGRLKEAAAYRGYAKARGVRSVSAKLTHRLAGV
ncbi:hypothetical protein B2K_39275 [Paenibacillus mucilaginosus K02]|uniref:Uncharacterized protein n=1 Tax=Paenibacillus mucilaginosus K02 TaxID=997761 RepID=R9UN39_9BACL|nr:hypothetical protein B2K_39275 [Paenibacillus mucilaginosus K02]